MLNTTRDKIAGAIYGVAVGDALGATMEFAHPILEPRLRHTEMMGGGWLNLKKGEWTDDTDLTLAVAEGIIANPANPVPAIGERFMAWLATNPRDIGNTTRAALNRFAQTGDWATASSKSDRTASNGALMRTVPVALAYEGEALYRHALAIADMTHGVLFAGWTCLLYCHTVQLLLIPETPAGRYRLLQDACRIASGAFWQDLVKYGTNQDRSRLNEFLIALGTSGHSDEEMAARAATGHTVDTLACAIWAVLEANSFEEALVEAVNLGGDADTVGAVAGGLAGAAWGYQTIPERWLQYFTAEQKTRLDRIIEYFVTSG